MKDRRLDLTPDFRAHIDGVDRTGAMRAALVELRVVTTSDRATDTVEIALADDAAPIDPPPRGSQIDVAIGYAESGGPVEMGRFWHTETDIELAPPSIRIRGTGADLRPSSALKSPRTRAWHDTTLGAIVDAVAAEHALTPRVGAALAATTIAHVDQTSESDLHFLRRLATDYDATAKMADDALVFAPAGEGVAASGAEMPAFALTPRTGALSARVAYRDRPKVASVRAPYWRYVEAAPRFAVAGDGTPAHDLPDPFPDQPRAQSAATARLRQFVRATAQLEAELPGTPELSAGARITTTGWPVPAANGDWIATRVTHSLTPSGFTTSVTASAPTSAE